jgi:hypothetical protein
MTKTDFTCPNCRRVRRRESEAETHFFKCSCVGGQLIQCPRVKLELADWTLLDQPLADALGVGIHYVRAKRAELGKPHGTLGRKKYSQRIRRVDASLIDPKKSVKENAEKLKCSPQRIRQILKELSQATQ